MATWLSLIPFLCCCDFVIQQQLCSSGSCWLYSLLTYRIFCAGRSTFDPILMEYLVIVCEALRRNDVTLTHAY